MKYKLVGQDITKNYVENLLKQRGIENVDLFLHPTEECLQDWKNLENIEQGLEIIKNTIYDSAPYALIVDADCDGFSSSAIIYQYLKLINPKKQIDYYLHSAKQHGLEDLWEKIQETNNYQLIISPDGGSNDSQYAVNFNCPILILDHHILEDEKLASNIILINTQTSPKYQNKNLSGGGVTWQFCRGLDTIFNVNYAQNFIDLAALSIDSDMMSMLEYENQYIVQTGFNNINNFFFKILIEKQAFSMGNKVNPITVAFYIVPLINGMIRVGTQEEKERLFLAFINGEQLVPCNKRGAKGIMEKVAIESARECTNAKSRQDRLKEQITSSLDIKIHKNGLLDNKILFIRLDDDDDFPPELNGICAMQLASKYNKPTIVARLNDEGYIRGSIRGLNQSELISFKDFLQDSNYFDYVVGHANAGGCSIQKEKLLDFHKYANERLKNINFENIYNVDFIREAKDIDIDKIIIDLSKYDYIWGQNNPEPLIYISNIFIRNTDVQIIGKNKDTVKFEKNGIVYIKFHAKSIIEQLNQYDEMRLNIIGKANLNQWMGREVPQIFIENLEVFNSEFDF